MKPATAAHCDAASETIVRIAQMSDLHYCAKNLDESDRCFTAAVTQAIEQNVHCAVITGDSTDHAMDAHSPALVALAKQIQRLANHCPVLMLQGTFSHEPPGLLKLLAMIKARHCVAIAERIGSYGLTYVGFELIEPGTAYRLVVSALPTLNKADIAAMVSDEVGSAAMEAGRIVADVLASLAPMHRALRARKIPTMVISHGTVLNCISEHGVPMAGTDHEFGAGALFSAQADAVALGHIHKHQSWESDLNDTQQLIAYAGSIGRFHHGEIDEKVWVEWQLVAGQPSFITHPTPARETVDLFFDGPPDMQKLRSLASECQGAWVRVRYEVDEEHRQGIDRAAIKLLFSGAAGVQIEGKTLIVERVRALGISTSPTLAEKLDKWCQVTCTPSTEVSERLVELQNDEAETIVRRYMEKIDAGQADQASDTQANVGSLPERREPQAVFDLV
jgi:DNA repair protein SbcD/Mre11